MISWTNKAVRGRSKGFMCNDTVTTVIYTLDLRDARPMKQRREEAGQGSDCPAFRVQNHQAGREAKESGGANV